MNPDAPSDQIYRLVIGANAEYYVPRFRRFESGGAAVSWNWPAFFFTFIWLLYRRMYGWAAVYLLLWPLAVVAIVMLLTLIVGEELAFFFAGSLVLLVPYVVLPVFANATYHRHVRKKIAAASGDAPSQEMLIQRLIGQGAPSGGGSVVVMGVVGAGLVFFLGIFSAIAVPAYQDFTIRSQVVEGLNLAAPLKSRVIDAYQRRHRWPADSTEAGYEVADSGGQFVETIEVSDGAILIHYGRNAHQRIAGGTLALHPVPMSEGFTWVCGYRVRDVAHLDELPTDIPPAYLPAVCRSQST